MFLAWFKDSKFSRFTFVAKIVFPSKFISLYLNIDSASLYLIIDSASLYLNIDSASLYLNIDSASLYLNIDSVFLAVFFWCPMS